MTTILQKAIAAAQPTDPNTMVAANPAQQQQAAAPTIADEMQQFVDQWALAPGMTPGARTWTDPSKRAQADGTHLAAWFDQPLEAQQAPFTDATAEHNAQVISGMQQKAEAAKPAKPAPTLADYWGGIGAGGGEGGGDAGGVAGGTSGGTSGGNSAGDATSGDGGTGTSGDGSGSAGGTASA